MRAATTQIAAGMPKASATTPAEQRADGEPAVAPEPVDPDRAGPPGRVCDVADGGQQGRVDHRGPAPSSTAASAQTGEGVAGGDQGQRGGLEPHAGDDEPFAAPPVGERAGDQLAGPHTAG